MMIQRVVVTRNNLFYRYMATLLKGDCLEIMKGIADKSVDLIICDLPYGCLTGGCSWDVKLNLELFWKEIKRIRKDDHTPTLHFCTTKFGNELINSNPKEFRYDLVWDKQRGVSFLSANKMPMRSHEMIYVFSKAGAKYNRIDISGNAYTTTGHSGCNTYSMTAQRGEPKTVNTRCSLSVINNLNTAGRGKHPTEKPIDLYKFLISRYSKEGDTVLDPTFGSGNSGEVCKELKRKYIGIEKDEKFFWKYVSKQ